MFISVWRVSLACAVLGILVSCRAADPPDYKAIIGLPQTQRRARIQSLPYDRQIDIYIRATRGEPPILLVTELASQGGNVVTPVLSRLRSENREIDKYYLVFLLSILSQNFCSLAHNHDVIMETQKQVEAMKGPYKTMAQDALRRLMDRPVSNNVPECGSSK